MFSYKPNKIYIPFEKNYETLMSELKWELINGELFYIYG